MNESETMPAADDAQAWRAEQICTPKFPSTPLAASPFDE
jgi:hypothetical protein